MAKRTWKITNLDGSNKRTVTLDQFRAELNAAKIAAERIAEKNLRRWVEGFR